MHRRVVRVRVTAAAVGVALAGAAGCQTSGTPGPIFPGAAAANAVPDGMPAPVVGGGGRGRLGGDKPHLRPTFKAPDADDAMLPKELNKVTMPAYTVEAPDVLLINAQRVIPLPPYRIEPLDTLYLSVPGSRQATAPEREINGPYVVQPDGTVDLGPIYGGPVRVNDLTVAEAEKVVEARVKASVKEPAVSASLLQARGAQQISGEHLINPDGTVSLGLYGSVYVAGMTTAQVKQAVEAHLAQTIYKPEVSVQVAAYNSKYYYVITDFAGAGAQFQRLPATGNETVLDALSLIGGLSPVSSNRVWVARPAPTGVGDQILPVDLLGITRRGTTRTNYQILPGDRVFVMAQPVTKFDTRLAQTLAPVERVLGTALFGATTVQTIQGRGVFGNNNGAGTVVNVAPQ